MHSHKQINLNESQVITAEESAENNTATIADDYKKLNEKCDNIISKFKARKSKKSK